MPEEGGENRKLRAIFLIEKGIDLDELEDKEYFEAVHNFRLYQDFKRDTLIATLKQFSKEIGLITEE